MTERLRAGDSAVQTIIRVLSECVGGLGRCEAGKSVEKKAEGAAREKGAAAGPRMLRLAEGVTGRPLS